MISEYEVDAAIGRVLEREGGFVDRAEDRGGPTKYGITARALGDWRNLGRTATSYEVAELAEPEARAIYKARYVTDPGLRIIPYAELFDLVFDSAVNHGPERAVKWLQEPLGVKVDGQLGPKTAAALEAADAKAVLRAVFSARLKFYGRILAGDASQHVFAAGWLNRLSEFVPKC